MGDGTGEVATLVDSGPGNGCGYPAASGCLFDGDESGRPGSVCPLAAGTAFNILELGLDSRGFPSAEVAAGALGPRVRRASVQMEAMGLWRPSLDPAMMP